MKVVKEVLSCDSGDDGQFVCCSCTLLIIAKRHCYRRSKRTTKEVLSYVYYVRRDLFFLTSCVSKDTHTVV